MINYQKLLHKNQQNTIQEEQHTIIFNWMLGRQPTRLSPLPPVNRAKRRRGRLMLAVVFKNIF